MLQVSVQALANFCCCICLSLATYVALTVAAQVVCPCLAEAYLSLGFV